MIRPATSISPALGRSSPAIERSVVVLPQPEGPSSVNNLPSGTSKLTSCAARTGVPRSPGYSVDSDLTLSTFGPHDVGAPLVGARLPALFAVKRAAQKAFTPILDGLWAAPTLHCRVGASLTSSLPSRQAGRGLVTSPRCRTVCRRAAPASPGRTAR